MKSKKMVTSGTNFNFGESEDEYYPGLPDIEQPSPNQNDLAIPPAIEQVAEPQVAEQKSSKTKSRPKVSKALKTEKIRTYKNSQKTYHIILKTYFLEQKSLR